MDINYLIAKANELIVKPRKQIVLRQEEYNTADIIRYILFCDLTMDKSMCRFAKLFPPTSEGLRTLWTFVHTTMKFVMDKDMVDNPEKNERVRTPQNIWDHRTLGVNCKGYSNFIASILKCNKIKYRYRFPIFVGEKKVRHVYPVATIANVDYYMDATVDRFNYAEPFSKVIEIDPQTINNIDQIANYNPSMALEFINAPNIITNKATMTAMDKFKEAPKNSTAKKTFNFIGSTQGQFLLDQAKYNLEIQGNYYGDPTGDIQAKMDILNDYDNKLNSSQKPSVGAAVQQKFAALFSYINYAVANNTRLVGTNLTKDGDRISGPGTYADIKAYNDAIHGLLNTLAVMLGRGDTDITPRIVGFNQKWGTTLKTYPDVYTATVNSDDSFFFADLFNKYLEDSSHSLVYEYLNSYKYDTGHNTLNNKILAAQSTNSNMAIFSYIDRINLIAWETNGIARIGAKNKLVDITPAFFINDLAKIKGTGAGIGNPITLTVVLLTILLGASEVAIAFFKNLVSKRASVADQIKSLGNVSLQPSPDDWATAVSTTASSGGYLIPLGILAAGGAILAVSK